MPIDGQGDRMTKLKYIVTHQKHTPGDLVDLETVLSAIGSLDSHQTTLGLISEWSEQPVYGYPVLIEAQSPNVGRVLSE